MSRIEKVRLAIMVMNTASNKPETVEEVIAVIEKIIKTLRLDD